MKNSTVLIIGLLFLFCDAGLCSKKEVRKNPGAENSLIIGCSPDLFDLTGKWAEAFGRLYPDAKIEVKKVAESFPATDLDRGGYTALISSVHPVAEGQSIWHMVIGRDVTVPIFSSENPFRNELSQQGISPEEFAQVLNNPGKRHWGTLINNKENNPVHFYMIDDASIYTGMARLLGLDKFTPEGMKVESGEKLISSVQSDPYSIGFCKITDILDPDGRNIAEGIQLVPLDRNNNGNIDYMEDLYGDLYDLSRGVWTGKYPKALVHNIYFISPVKPAGGIENSFVNWILSDGQQFLDPYGISGLLYAERQTKMNMLDDNELNIITADDKYATPIWIWFILGSFALVVVTVIVVNMRQVSSSLIEEVSPVALETAPVIDEQIIDVPKGILYDKTHTWAYMEKDGLVRLGIDDFLQHITGPITRVRLKSRGETIRKGQPVLSIVQNGKQLSINAPVSGKIKEQNKILSKKPSLVNTSPYSDGWVYIIEPANWSKESQFLAMWEKYRDWLKSEFSRLRDFLAASVQPNAEYAHVMQDGGEPKDGILEDLGPEVWEDFQTNFLDLPV